MVVLLRVLVPVAATALGARWWFMDIECWGLLGPAIWAGDQYARPMRMGFHDRLIALNEQLAHGCGLVSVALDQATDALLQADLVKAEEVITGHRGVAALSVAAFDEALSLLALQAPVAGDLREVVGSISIAADVERMSALAQHVAKIVRRRHPERALPPHVDGYFAEMGRVGVESAVLAQQLLLDRDPQAAARIDGGDDAMDDLRRRLFAVVMDQAWSHDVASAVDVTLLGRFYERFSDHAVQVGRRVMFQITGQRSLA